MARKLTKQQEELLKEYRKVAQRANKKLERLEKLADNPDYENVLNYAYRIAARDVKELNLGDTEKVRYRVPYDKKTGRYNTNMLKAALRRAKEFENMVTSSKTGIDTTYRQDALNFNAAFGTNYTWQELKEFTDAVNWNDLKKQYESGTIQRIIRKVISHEISADKVQSAIENHKTISGLDKVESSWLKQMYDSGLNPDLLFKGTGEFESVSDDESPFID